MAAMPPAGMPMLPPQQPGAVPGPPPPGPRPPMPGGGGQMSGMMMLLAFLAGGGLEKAVNSIGKIVKMGQPGSADPNRQHKGGVRLDAAQAPGMTIAPQMAQMLAAKSAQQPSGSDDLVGLLAKALQMQTGGPLGGIG